ncbi:MAG: hypothetical protein IKN88_04705, partial [Bacteroidales bacterium]|nr:hypothetical protein [Bacteroidales bacterium]
MKKSILLSVTAAIATALMWAGLPQKANGQSMPGVPSVDFYPPSAASLITSVEYPVSHMTGVPDISIPLYTVRSGDLELPIVLRFHSGEFFRSNTYSGPLGAGWSLSCDMEVTHSIRGLSDIVGASTPQQRIVPSEDNYGNLTLTDTQKRQLAKGVADGEPDLFYYSTLSGDGRFYLGNDGSSVTMLECNGDKVQFSSGGQAAFTVTDSHGRVHSYAGNSGPMDTSGGMVFSWKLKGIRTYNAKDSISFSYYRDTLPMPLMSDRIELYDSLSLSGAFTHEQLRIPRLDLGNGMVRHLIRTNYSPTGYQLQWDNSPAPPEFYYSNPRNNHYVSRISFRGGHVEFQYQTIHPYYYYTAYVTLLSRMDVYADGNSTPIKTIIFEYPSSITIRDHCTATLSSITINGTEKYSFDYPADVRRMGGTDFWSSGPGGYPGIPSVLYSQVELPPGMMWNMTTATWSNESRVYTDNQGGWHVLRQSSDRTFTITYPTGGKTVFTFENDRYHDTESTIAMTTTRRVSRIRHYDRDNTLLKTIRYEYGENGDGVGHIWHMPTLTAADMSGMMARTSSMTEQLIKYYNRIGGGAGSGYYSFVAYARRRTYIHGTVFDDCFRGDRFISYPVVTEYQDNDGTVAGKRVYRYDLNLGAVNDMSEKTFPYTIQQEYWQCGRPESEASYRHTANGWQLVDSTAYVYGEFYGQSNIKVARAWQKTVAIEVNGNMTADEVYDRSEYTFRTAKMQVGCNRLLQTVLTERADDGRLLVTTQQKGYLNNIHPHIPKTNTITYP